MGPLEGVRILAVGGIGPGPFAAMVLSDLGADVVRVDRTDAVGADERELEWLVHRGSRSIAVNIKMAEGRDVVLALAESADVMIEGFRPGVAERLGIGPDVCCARNSALVYAHVTGWGQDGPWAQVPGHDINYLAVTGALNAIGRRDSPPPPPLNFLGDYSGGGLMCALGILAALYERERSGRGQVIDAAMVDGIAVLSTLFHGLRHLGALAEERESNNLDGGAPWYDSYECADGRYIAIGGGEAPFFESLCEMLDLLGQFPDPMDRSQWEAMRKAFADAFRRRTRDDWSEVVPGARLCLSPVLSWAEAPANPQLAARGTFVVADGVMQPAPAPRLSRTPSELRLPPPWPGEHTDEVAAEWDVKRELIDAASLARAVKQRGDG